MKWFIWILILSSICFAQWNDYKIYNHYRAYVSQKEEDEGVFTLDDLEWLIDPGAQILSTAGNVAYPDLTLSEDYNLNSNFDDFTAPDRFLANAFSGNPNIDFDNAYTLFTDGLMETWTDANTLTNWTKAGLLDIDGTNKYSGTYSAKLTESSGQSSIYQTKGVIAGKLYQLSFWCRGDGTNQGQYAVYDVTNSAWIVTAENTGVTAATWTQVIDKFYAPATCVSMQVYFYSPTATAGYTNFDEAYLELMYEGLIAKWVFDGVYADKYNQVIGNDYAAYGDNITKAAYLQTANHADLQITGDLSICFKGYFSSMVSPKEHNVINKNILGEYRIELTGSGGVAFYHGNGGSYEYKSFVIPIYTRIRFAEHIFIRNTGDSKIYYYCNGILINSLSYTITPTTSTSVVRLFRGNNYASGIYLKSVQIYNKVLSTTEIQQVCDGVPPSSGLMADWRFDDPALWLTDRSGRGHTLTNSNAELVHGAVNTPLQDWAKGGAWLGQELSSGTLDIGSYYKITATTTNFFGTGLIIGDYFYAMSALTLTSERKVKKVSNYSYLNAYTGRHLMKSTGFDFTTAFSGTSPIYSGGTGLQFDGVNDYLYIPIAYSDVFNPYRGNFSIELWLKNGTSANYEYWVGLAAGGGHAGWGILKTNENIIRGEIYGSTGNRQHCYLTNGSTLLLNNQPHHLFCTFNNATKSWSWYTDGVFRETNVLSDAPGKIYQNNYNFFVGALLTYWYYSGTFYQAAYYNKALSAQEVKELYAAGYKWRTFTGGAITPQRESLVTFDQRFTNSSSSANYLSQTFYVRQGFLHELDLHGHRVSGTGNLTIELSGANTKTMTFNPSTSTEYVYYFLPTTQSLIVKIYGSVLTDVYQVNSLDINEVTNADWAGTTMNDYSENNQDGTLYGTMEDNQPANPYAVYFDGVNDYISYGDVNDLLTQNFIWQGWFKSTDVTSKIIYSKYVDANNQFEIYTTAADKLAIYGIDGGVVTMNYVTTTTLFDNQWKFISVIADHDASNVRVFFNTTEQTMTETTDINETVLENNGNVYEGRYSSIYYSYRLGMRALYFPNNLSSFYNKYVVRNYESTAVYYVDVY